MVNNIKKYTFRVTETASKVVTVYAVDSDEAQELAIDCADLGKNPNDYECVATLLEEGKID